MSKEINFLKYEPDSVSQFTIDHASCSKTIYLAQENLTQQINTNLLIEQKSRSLFTDFNLKDRNGFSHDRIFTITTMPNLSKELDQLLSKSPDRLRLNYLNLIKEISDAYNPQIQLTPDFLQMHCLGQTVFAMDNKHIEVNESLLQHLGIKAYNLDIEEKPPFFFSFETEALNFECDAFKDLPNYIKACIYTIFSTNSFTELRNALFQSADNDFKTPFNFSKTFIYPKILFDLA